MLADETHEPNLIVPIQSHEDRIQLLVIVIWFGGLLDLIFSNGLRPAEAWSWAGFRILAALICMFLLGTFAFASITEHGFAKTIRKISKVSIFLLVAGVIAAISVGCGSAAFLMFILTGFALNWWGLARQ